MRIDDNPVASSEHTIWNGTEPARSIFGKDQIEQCRELAASSPVVRFPGGGIVVASTAAVDYVMHNPQEFSSGPGAFFLGSEDGLIPIQKDPPEHTRYRKMLDRLFAPRVVALLADSVAEHTNRCIDSFIDTGRCDVVADLGIPVPSGTILALLGFPLDRLDEFLSIKDDIFRPPMDLSAEELKAFTAQAGMRAFEFFGSVLDERGGDPRDDLATHLARLEADGELSRPESAEICLMLLLAGLDTVTTSIANFFYHLSLRPDLRDRLVADPELIPSAVEELLRYVAPIPNSPRIAVADVEVEGCPIRKGDRVAVLIPISNWDPSHYANPDEIDLDRPANRHVSFGMGRHRCLGSHLARMELQVLLREWHRRIPTYGMPDGHVVEWNRGIREISSLPLEFPVP